MSERTWMASMSLSGAGCIAAAMVAMTPTPGKAALLIDEHFDYPTGALTSVTTNWTEVSPSGQVTVVPDNLSYPTLATSVGKQLDLNQNGSDPYRSFTMQNSGDIYYSFLLKVLTRGTLSGNSESGSTTALFGLYRAGGTTSGTAPLVAVPHPSDGTQFKLGTKITISASSAASYDDVYQQVGDTLLVVLRVRYTSATQGDVSLWVNPSEASLGQASPPTADATTPVGTLSTLGYDKFYINQPGSTTGLGDSRFDSLRVGNTWAEVTPVPEPSLALAGGLAVPVLLRRRRGC